MRILTPLLALSICATAARADFSADLLAAYFFNGNSEDASGRGQHGQLVGATLTADRHGRADGAVLLDGSGAYVATPVNGKRFPLSMSFWYRLDAQPGSRPFSIVDSGIGDAFGHSFVIGSGPDRLNANLAATFTFRKGVWTHVVVTYGPKLRVYMDGQFVAEKDHAEGDDFVAGNFQLGRHFGGDGRYFQGALDDVLIYGRTLTDREVADLHANSQAVAQHVQLAAAAKAELALRAGGAGRDPAVDDDGATATRPIAITVSSAAEPDTNGWAVIDGDTNTVWTGAPGESGWWLALEYDPPVPVSGLEVSFAGGSPTNLAVFHSTDADAWPELPAASDQEAVAARYLLLTFPAGETAVPPRVSEILLK